MKSQALGPRSKEHLLRAASRHRLLSDPTRLAIVLSLRRGPATPQGLASGAGLHVNTIRSHLARLEKGGIVVSEREEPSGPGRPRTLYRLSPDSQPPDLGGREYRLLAEAMIGLLRSTAGENAPRLALPAGESWGRYIAASDTPRPGRPVATEEAVAFVTGALERLQFLPEMRRSRSGWVILLHNCPFKEVALENEDVICAFHQGLLRGLLRAIGSRLDFGPLEPFIEPDLCRVRLSLPRPGGAAT